MCHAHVGVLGLATRTSGTSSSAGAHFSTAGTSGPAGERSPTGDGELFPVGFLPGAPGGSTGRGLLESNFLLFLAIVPGHTEG